MVLDLLAVQGTLKSLLQHRSSKASILWCSAFFTVQLSHPYMTTGKTIALVRQTFVSQVMSLFSNMLSRLVIAFLPSTVARTQHFHCQGPGFNLWLGSKDPATHVAQSKIYIVDLELNSKQICSPTLPFYLVDHPKPLL